MDYMNENPNAYDLRKINRRGIDYVKEATKSKIVIYTWMFYCIDKILRVVVYKTYFLAKPFK